MSDDDRPKKSWRELDRMRDRSGGSGGGTRRNRSENKGQERAEKSQAYRSYKSQLDKLFTPGGGAELPDSLKAMLGPKDEQSQERERLIKALNESKDEASLQAFIDAQLPLPDDARLLMHLLDVTDEEALLCPVLDTLLEIVESGKRPNRMLLIQKLDALKLRLGSGEAVDRAVDLRAALD